MVCAVAAAASAQQPSLPPGEPTSPYAKGFASPRGMAFNLRGDLFVADPDAARIWRVPADGSTLSTFVGFAKARNIVRDGFGDLLVTTGGDTVYRVAPDRVRSVFAIAAQANGITVGPDGDVWVGARREIVRYSPLGARLATIALPAGCRGVSSIAISPTRVLHFSAGGCGVHRLVNGFPDLVIALPHDLGALTFDAHGWLWVTDTLQHAVMLFDPGYQLRENPFATRVSGQGSLAFVRGGAGMTPRLLAAAAGPEATIVEMNPRGMGAAGAGVGIDLFVTTELRAATRDVAYQDTLAVSNARGTPAFTLFDGVPPPGLTLSSNGVIRGTPRSSGTFRFSVVAQQGDSLGFGRITLQVNAITAFEVARVLLGIEGAALDPDVARFVDQQGNNNTLVDIGDLRAYLRKQGTLP
jgi:hypothetical protein